MPTAEATYTYEDLERIARIAGVSPMEVLSLADAAAKDATAVAPDAYEANSTRMRCVDWAQRNFYIPGNLAPIKLLPHQIAMLDFLFEQDSKWTTMIWSTIKKSGKTTISAMLARWVIECWGNYPEVVLAANDREQSRGLLYQSIVNSIELTPGYDAPRHTLRDEQGNPLWRIIERELQYVPTHGKMRAISGDYAGESGSNPNASFFTELWAYVRESSKRLWAELTPVATRPGSFRFVDTYAGHTNEKGTLWDLYQRVVINGKQLYCHDIAPFGWPQESLDMECNCGTELGCCSDHNDGPGPNGKRDRGEMGGLPLFVHEPSASFAYWDSGLRARRMPWQRGELGRRYYQVEAASLRRNDYTRLHENGWTESEDAFIPILWWDACKDEVLAQALVNEPETLGVSKDEPCVLSADAAVSGDCCGLTLHTRHPVNRLNGALRAAWAWTPPQGGKFDYQMTIEQQIRYILQQCTDAVYHVPCAERWGRYPMDYADVDLRGAAKHGPALLNVVELCYDEFQLHDMMTRLRREGVVHCQQFGQGAPRAVADYALYTSIQQKRIGHPGAPNGYGTVSDGLASVREHLANANSKQKVDEDTRLRIIKKDEAQKIDLAVCTSMGDYEIKRLLIE